MKKDLISLDDFTSQEVIEILDLASKLKEDRTQGSIHLSGKSVGLLFQKPSNRTRVSFEVGIAQLGGNCIYLGPKEIDLGKRESTHDVAQTLSRYLDCIVARTNSNFDVVELAKNASIPIINALCDVYHPCQGLADLLTVKENFNTFQDITLAYVGDGNNVCHSLLLAGAKVGMNVSVATPQGYEPSSDVFSMAQEIAIKTGSSLSLSNDPVHAVSGAHAVYGDVWVSMGEESDTDSKLKDFDGFQINEELVKHAADNYIFMHCLPAHRDLEVTADVIDGDHSVIFDQAENRLHAQKAVLMKLVK